uniref:G-protein coupled receptors family 1 profile domain-containing protein n=1 Tax=Ditylenchus dipsaci TaxID=166011 RepID=A0A915EAK9_9BILA
MDTYLVDAVFSNQTLPFVDETSTASMVLSTATSSQHNVLTEPLCFDLIVFYRSIAEEDSNALNVLAQLETYSKFSFAVNGLVTCLLASLDCLQFPIVCQALLLCCLLTYGIMASYYGILPFVGVVAYLLYFFQPFASFCVTGTIWQVLAITVERYNAVSKPLEQRTRNAQFSLKTICGSIAVGAFLLNMVVVPFERSLTDCYEFTQNGFQIRKMIVQQDLVNNQFYAILAHLIPDIIFRAPTPIIMIAILTVRTLQICSRRTVGSQTIQQASRNIPLMLTLLNVKFIMCNTLYMFNTILMEVMGYGGKTSSQQTELEMEQYISSLYLTDFSNMLLALHSATNWLIFYRWGNWSIIGNKRKRKFSSLTMTSNAASKTTVLDVDSVELLLQKFSADKYKTACDILATLCANSIHMAKLLVGKEVENEWQQKNLSAAKDHFTQDARIKKHAIILGDLIVVHLSVSPHPVHIDWYFIKRKFCGPLQINPLQLWNGETCAAK